MLTEHALGKGTTIGDGSAAITGVLLGLTLPAGMPMWMAALGGFFGIAFGKLMFGGLGYNVFNPALFGRAFLQAAFPVALTTWPATGRRTGGRSAATTSRCRSCIRAPPTQSRPRRRSVS